MGKIEVFLGKDSEVIRGQDREVFLGNDREVFLGKDSEVFPVVVSTVLNFKFKIAHLIYWLPLKSRDPGLSCYLNHRCGDAYSKVNATL